MYATILDRRTAAGFLALLMTLVQLGCANDSADDGADKTSDTVAAVDPSEALYDANTLVTVDIEMSEDDWKFVRNDKRSFAGNDLSCPTGPFVNTYTWKEATKVTVDGQTVNKAGIRKKGFIGSVNSIKPSLKIRFDKFVEGQELYGITRLTLNNNLQDASQLVQCLAYDLARKAGLVASRCNFARVTVNGEFLGVYSNVESIKKRMISRFFDDADGDLYEGTVADFRDDWMITFEAKTDATDPALGPIKALTEALKAPDADLLGKLSPLLDMQGFYTFWALNQLMGNADSYFTKGNNYFLYNDPAPDGRMHFILWGADATFYDKGGTGGAFSVGARPVLARRLYLLPEGQKKFFDVLKNLLADVWDEAVLKAEIDRMESLIAKSVAEGPDLGKGGKGGGGYPDSTPFIDAVANVQSFVAGRRALVKSVIDNPPPWKQKLSQRNCSGGGGGKSMSSEGSGMFKTTAGSAGTDPATSGSGTMAMKQDGVALKITGVSSAAGPADKDKTRYEILIRGSFDAGKKGDATVIAGFQVDAKSMTDGALLKWSEEGKVLSGFVGFVDSKSGKVVPVADMSKCALTLDKASTTTGEAVEGSFDCSWGKSTGKSDPQKDCYDACRKKGSDASTCKSTCYKK